eukprot:CAMPEP_0115000164 /NCGR_PEP_ID=MMETSP0216-20121206/16592_1 /TAXON_ID=223996 /ORGANISM="Protocruzia adherens, Strain Boccale" /LENGTH=592 /DNA_ID=CAMNT_0002365205 /DNA_START=36 /DNA_END=1814 /DNA_ORIENTATION=+
MSQPRILHDPVTSTTTNRSEAQLRIVATEETSSTSTLPGSERYNTPLALGHHKGGNCDGLTLLASTPKVLDSKIKLETQTIDSMQSQLSLTDDDDDEDTLSRNRSDQSPRTDDDDQPQEINRQIGKQNVEFGGNEEDEDEDYDDGCCDVESDEDETIVKIGELERFGANSNIGQVKKVSSFLKTMSSYHATVSTGVSRIDTREGTLGSSQNDGRVKSSLESPFSSNDIESSDDSDSDDDDEEDLEIELLNGDQEIQRVKMSDFMSENFVKTFKLSTRENVLLEGMEGWLWKKSPKMMARYQKRYFRLQNKKLYYYRKKEDTQPLGCINFDLVTVNIRIEDKETPTKFSIFMLANPRIFKLKAEDTKTLYQWAAALRLHINHSRGHEVDQISLSIQKKFWKFDRISEEQFLKSVETGDILLFRGDSFGSKVQRSFTRSAYDHVGLLLRYDNDKIGVLESTGLEGVGIVTWDQFMSYKWHLLYSRLVYRQMDMERPKEVILKLENYIRKVLGKKYKISTKKLLRRFSVLGEEKDEEDQSFFCSELIAAAYKEIGILPPELSASQYWPGSFSSERSLPLQNGAKLGPELLLDFTL